MSEDRLEVDILGRNLGTASSWDGDPGETIWFYDFEPKEGIDLPKGDLQIDFINGHIGSKDETGEINLPLDIVLFLQSVPR